MRPWVDGHFDLLLSQVSYSHRNADKGYQDEDHLMAAAQWLEQAQDATSDDGVTGRYGLTSGWTSSYPETTGYIIPTLLQLADESGDRRFYDRAERSVEFLLGLQLQNGAFPGGEVHENVDNPSPFNTAQIVNGLIAWHKVSGCQRTEESLRRAGDWLVSVQDDDGAFRHHFYNDEASTYSAHLSCWLAELGEHFGNQHYLAGAHRHMDWVLQHYDAKAAWFDLCGFDTLQHADREAFTHTIAYTIWGVLYCGRVFERNDLISAARQSARKIAHRLELSRTLPGILNFEAKGNKDFVCLTGSAQMALIWMELFELDGDLWWLNPAFKAIDEVKRAQFMDNSNAAIRGGIAGSHPVWGPYIRNALPNWAPKFFIDAVLKKRDILEKLGDRTVAVPSPDSTLPRKLPETEAGNTTNQPNVVFLTRSDSTRLAHFASELEKRGVKPGAVVFETMPDPSVSQRILQAVSERGFKALVNKVLGRKSASQSSAAVANSSENLPSAEAYCRQRNIKTVAVGKLTDPTAIEQIKQLSPDVLIQAGVGILRKGLLDVPSLGTLNVHMSLLPRHRGMNVAEWAAMEGHDNGVTVHLIDKGIDTGPITLAREVSRDGCSSIASLRSKIDREQRVALADVVTYIVKSGSLPPLRTQRIDEGRQYYAMHHDIRAVLEQELSGSSG